jgi:cytochrome c553
MRASPYSFLIALALSMPAIAQAGEAPGARIVAQGTPSGAPACVACHGADLHGITALKSPAIAGRPASYILARLAHYASAEGHNAQMKQVATALSPADRQAVADYLAGLKP